MTKSQYNYVIQPAGENVEAVHCIMYRGDASYTLQQCIELEINVKLVYMSFPTPTFSDDAYFEEMQGWIQEASRALGKGGHLFIEHKDSWIAEAVYIAKNLFEYPLYRWYIWTTPLGEKRHTVWLTDCEFPDVPYRWQTVRGVGIDNMIENATIEGDTIVDPFCDNGSVVFRALHRRRNVICGDVDVARCKAMNYQLHRMEDGN